MKEGIIGLWFRANAIHFTFSFRFVIIAFHLTSVIYLAREKPELFRSYAVGLDPIPNHSELRTPNIF